jgi:hypothetical protein
MIEAPRLPTPVRLLNAAARPFERLLPALSLKPEGLEREAIEKTGLTDFGDGAFRVGLEQLTADLDRQGNLHALGRSITRGRLISALSNRLEIQKWRSENPTIAAQRIERPIVFMGMGRTGTTILHDLMAQDPGNRVPLSWETAAPCPPPEAATYASDPRIAANEAESGQVERLIPNFRSMHPMGPHLPQECVQLLESTFVCMTYQITYHVPEYSRWLHEEADLGAAYQFHRKFLQHLQWKTPGRWVLKSPCHLWHIEALLAEYPDAILIQTHRDPLKIAASLASLGTTLHAMCARPVAVNAIAEHWAHWSAVAYERGIKARDEGRVTPDRILDVNFRDFMSDPFETIRRIYGFAGLDFTSEVEERMRAFLASNPDDKHGKHSYGFVDTGLDENRERDRVRGYQDRFQVPSEPL